MTRSLNFASPARRHFLLGGAATTLSAATVALLAGNPALAAQSNLLEKSVLTLAIKFQDDHKAHRDRLIQVIRTLGATPVEEKSLAEYAKALEVDKLKSQTDVLNFAADLEDEAVNAYSGIIPAFQDRQLAKLVGQIAADETEHYSLLSHALGRPLPAPLSFGV